MKQPVPLVDLQQSLWKAPSLHQTFLKDRDQRKIPVQSAVFQKGPRQGRHLLDSPGKDRKPSQRYWEGQATFMKILGRSLPFP